MEVSGREELPDVGRKAPAEAEGTKVFAEPLGRAGRREGAEELGRRAPAEEETGRRALAGEKGLSSKGGNAGDEAPAGPRHPLSAGCEGGRSWMGLSIAASSPSPPRPFPPSGGAGVGAAGA